MAAAPTTARARSLLKTPVYELAALQHLVRTWRERLTAGGRQVLVASGVLTVLAIDTRRNQTFLIFSVAVGLLVSALVLARLARGRARLRLALPVRATAGQALSLRGRLEIERPGAVFRVTFGQHVVPRRLAIAPDDVLIAADEPGAVDVRFELTPHRRGRYLVGPLTVRALDPLGLVAGRSCDALAAQTLLVAPPIFAWEAATGALGRRLQPGGIPLASGTGDTMELVGTREWRPGDRLRNVHWRSFARRGAPIVKEFHEEWFPRVAVVVDTHLAMEASEADRAAFEASLSVAASIAAALADRDHVVELLAAGPELYRVSVGRGLGQLDEVLDVLACVEGSKDAPLAAVAPVLEEEIGQIGTVFVVALDWDAARAELVDRLEVLGAETHVVLVREGATSAPFREGIGDERLTLAQVAAMLRGAR